MKSIATGSLAVGKILRNAAIRHHEKEAVYCVHTGRRFSYLELNERTNRLANGLMDLGLKKGDDIAFLLTNRCEIAEAYFAIAKTGIVGFPMNYRLLEKEIVQMMLLGDVKVFIFEDIFTHIAEYVRRQIPGVKTYIGVGKDIPAFAIDYEKFLSDSSPGEPDVEIRDEDAHYMNLTSGTTGLPKAYILTHYHSGVALLGNNVLADDVVMTVFPMHGRTGWAWTSLSVFSGAKHVIMNFDPKKTLEVIQSEKVTLTCLVPAMANFLMSFPEFDKYDLSSLRHVAFCAAPFPIALQEQVRKRMTDNISEFYGMQECGSLVAEDIEEKKKKPASQGKIVPMAEVRIVDASGNDVPTGTIGEIIGKTPYGISAYYKNEEQTKNTFKNGWCYTGDLGCFDEEGYLYLSGRVKDMIVTGGQNVFSAEVENVLISHPAVADCTVIGLPDKKWGEAITAVLVRKSGVKATEDDIIDFCKKEMAGFKVPKRIIWYEGDIPRNPNGKVTKYVLVEKYSNQ